MMTKRMLGCSLMGLLALVGVAQARQAGTFPKSMLIQSTPEGKTVKTGGLLRVDREGVRFEAGDGRVRYETGWASVTKRIYERTKKPRCTAGLLLAWPLLFTKEKQNDFTFESKGSFAFVKVRKSRFRAAVFALEAASGRGAAGGDRLRSTKGETRWINPTPTSRSMN